MTIRPLFKWIWRWLKSPSLWKFLERLKLVLEVIAIPAAAYWAYTLFIQADAPSLVTRKNLTGSINWVNKSANECQAEFSVEFHNIGRRALTVGRVELLSWYLKEAPQLGPNESVRLIDQTFQVDGQALLHQQTDALRYVYQPDEKYTQGFLYAVKRVPRKEVLFEIRMWREEDVEKPDPTWYFYTWDWACGDNPHEEADSQRTREEAIKLLEGVRR